jgi:hypothetical protein
MTNSNYPLGPLPAGAGMAEPGQFPGMTIGQILDRVFRLLRAHLKMYVGLALVPAVALLCVMVVMGGLAALMILPQMRDHPGPPALLSLLLLVPFGVVLYIAVFFVYALYAAAASYAVARTNQGAATTGAEAWAVAWKRAGQFIWLTFLLVLILAGPAYLVLGLAGGLFALFTFASHGSAAPLAMFAFMPMFMLLNLGAQVYMVLMFLRYGLAIPACVMEDLPAVAALKRSVALMHGAKGRIFVVLLVMYAATFIVIIGSEMVLFLVGGMGAIAVTVIGVGLHSPMLLFFFVPLGLLLVLVVLLVVLSVPNAGYLTALGVVYCDQRMRVDGAGGVALPPAGESV